jgi:hypothetical protein
VLGIRNAVKNISELSPTLKNRIKNISRMNAMQRLTKAKKPIFELCFKIDRDIHTPLKQYFLSEISIKIFSKNCYFCATADIMSAI